MRIKYQLNGIKLVKQALCVGDLIRYYGESKFKLAENIQKISQNRGVSMKLLNVIRNHTSTPGMTIDGFLRNLEIASAVDIFSFTINKKDPCVVFDIDSQDVELEVYMNPLFFATKGAMTQYLPGFRKPKLKGEGALDFYAKKAQEDWLRWFERELGRYHPHQFWKKDVLED